MNDDAINVFNMGASSKSARAAKTSCAAKHSPQMITGFTWAINVNAQGVEKTKVSLENGDVCNANMCIRRESFQSGEVRPTGVKTRRVDVILVLQNMNK